MQHPIMDVVRSIMSKFNKRFIAVTLASAMVLTSFTACGKKDKGASGGDDGVVTLTVYSQTANYSGIQQGWSGEFLKKELGIELNIVPEQDGVFQTRMTEGDLGDIVVWGSAGENYDQAIQQGMLLDWEEDDLLNEYGPYIAENFQASLDRNRKYSENLTGEPTLYGFYNNVASDASSHEGLLYEWDIRWDLYKELGYPEVKNLDDLYNVLVDMKKICPKDDNGNETYAVSMWPDWDGDMVMYVKSTATAYYGYDENVGLGLYDPSTGKYYPTLDEDGPYLEMLKWYNRLFQAGLVDPDSMTTDYNKMAEKLTAGGAFFSIFQYAGSDQYNSDEHLREGKMMYALKPEEASPIVYGLNTTGSTYIWTIGANTDYPDLCMELLNYLSTPTGRLNMEYGPKGEFWDYDEEGNTYFTDIGFACHQKTDTDISKETSYSGTFKDGQLQINSTTWSINATNPESNNEVFDGDYWKSVQYDTQYDIMEDWKQVTGADSVKDYIEAGLYTLSPGTTFTLDSKDDELKTTWSQVTGAITDGSWNAIYAKTDADYDKIVAKMIKEAKAYGYDECVEWSQKQADRRWQCELEEAGVDPAVGTVHYPEDSADAATE